MLTNRMNNRALITLILILISSRLFAQWECPSQLGASLKPIAKSKLYWASEITGGAGYLSNNCIFNSMGIVGIDLSGKKSTLYIEGGYKYWSIYDLDHQRTLDNKHLGIRELFYQYRSSFGKLTLGVQSASLDDSYLLNERMIGLNYEHSSGPWAVNFSGGSVTKDFARNGTFCAVGFLYDIIPGREIALLGNKLGQTNFIGTSLKFTPSKIRKSGKSDTDEPGLDEFSNQGFSEISTTAAPKAFSLESAGLVVYDEFGSWISPNVFLSGFFADIAMPAGINFNPEILYQNAAENNALIYSLLLEKSFEGSKSRTHLNLRFLGIMAIDTAARVLNSYSNIFAGNVLRLDARDMPFLQAGIKYSIPRYKTHLKLQYAGQVKSNPMQEFDMQIGKKIGRLLQATLMGGVVRSPALEKDALLGRIELRFYF